MAAGDNEGKRILRKGLGFRPPLPPLPKQGIPSERQHCIRATVVATTVVVSETVVIKLLYLSTPTDLEALYSAVILSLTS